MSEFFRALEQANRDRLQAKGGPPPADPEAVLARELTESSVIDPVVEDGGSGDSESAPADLAHPAPVIADGVEDHLVSLLDPAGFEAEQYRALRHLIEQLHAAEDLSVVAISSPGLGDGKTTTAINVAGALAQSPDAKILLIELDLRRPSLARYFGQRTVGAQGGLINAILKPELQLADVVREIPTFNLAVLGAGETVSAPYELLRSPRLGQLFDEARRRYDYVILDTPPFVVVPDCRVITRWVDGFIMVIAAHKTATKMCGEALELLDPNKLIGLVFNGDDRHLAARQYHGYEPQATKRAQRIMAGLRAPGTAWNIADRLRRTLRRQPRLWPPRNGSHGR